MQTLTFDNDQVAEVMRRLAYFQDISRNVIKRLARGACQVFVQRGEIVQRQSAPVEFVCIVVSGQLMYSMTSSDGGTKVLGFARREDSFGEAYAMQLHPSPVLVEAVRDSHLLVIDNTVWMDELHRDASMAMNALRNVSQGLINLIRDTEMCQLRSSVDRVLCYLRHHAEGNSQGEWSHEFQARKQDIAANLSMTPETFSRVLRGLEREGVIHVEGRRVRIIEIGRFGDWIQV